MKSFCLREHEVRGLLDGTVSLLVRPVKMRHYAKCPWARDENDDSGYEYIETGNPELSGHDFRSPCRCIMEHCPFGAPGERLWVRETFGRFTILRPFDKENIVYRADEPENEAQRWRPSIHMPRWACRIIIETESVRVGPVSEIGNAELPFVIRPRELDVEPDDPWEGFYQAYEVPFMERWDADYGKRHPWESSFAWFATVKRVEEEA